MIKFFIDKIIMIFSNVKALIIKLFVSLVKSCNIRFVAINIDRIGHLSMEPECHIKMKQLGLIKSSIDIIVPPSNSPTANLFLQQCWKQYFFFMTSKKLKKILGFLINSPDLRVDVQHYIVAFEATATYFEVQRQWGNRPPLIHLKNNHARQGQKYLDYVGLRTSDWFVCIHSREESFAPNEGQNFRNSNIKTFDLAIEYILSQGGWVFRLGDPGMQHLSYSHPHVIDYAHSQDKSDFLDIFLPSQCLFFLGSCSGLASVPVLFNRPVLSVNLCPLSAALSYTFRDLCLPKLIWSHEKDRLLTFSEILESPIGNFRFQAQFDATNVAVIDNSPTEILDGVKEMYLQLQTASSAPKASFNQKKFNSLFHKGHYSYGSKSRICNSFLSNYKFLL